MSAVKSIARVKLSDTGLAFEGIIDHQSIPALIANLPQAKSTSPVLDLVAVTRIDSAGLAFLIDWGKQHLEPGQKIRLSGTRKQTQQLIETMKLDALFEQQAGR